MGRRKFAKNSEDVRHFKLVARSQADPSNGKADATPLVLEPFIPARFQNKKDVDEAELLTIPESLQKLGPEVFGIHDGAAEDDDEAGDFDSDGDEECDEERRLAELDDDCYFPKDGYNYQQHLKTMSKPNKGGSVGGVVMEAPKKAEEEVVPEEKLKKQEATNQEEKEVLEALEEADLYEDLDDDLLEQILPGGAAEPLEVQLWGREHVEEANRMPDLSVLRAMHRQMLGEGEADSVCDAPADFVDETGAPVSNEQFEQFLEEEYNDDEIGEMENDDIVGPMDAENLEAIMDEYLEEKDAEQRELVSLYEPQEGKLDDVPRVIEETKAIIERHYADEPIDGDDETSLGDESDEDESKDWDCETILSTLSNVSNRPGKIDRIKIVKKLKPSAKQLNSIDENAEKEEEDQEVPDEEDDVVELPDVVTERKKDETPEEKRARKAGVKEMRRICRKMKKESKDMYKTEASKLVNQNSSDVRSKSRYVKL